MIQVENLCKSYKIPYRPKGLSQAFLSLLKRRYKTIKALDNVSFSIEKGEIVGYIGPNGAGKSTTIKILSGILRPDSGKCIINGRVPYEQREAHVAGIGVVFGQRSQLWWDVPVIDSYELLKNIYAVDDKTYNDNLELMTDTLDMKDLLDTPVRQLSLGQRMRCELAASLLHSPDILFLDEPTIGLDAVSKLAVRKFIKAVNREKKVTVILTTHDMNDIEALSNRIILIGKGQLLYDGKFENLKSEFSPQRQITVTYSHDNKSILPELFKNETIENGRAVYMIGSDLSVNNALIQLSKRYEIQDFSILDEAVENVVARIYKEYSI